MTTVLPDPPEHRPLVGFAVFAGVLAAYGAFAILISLVAAFANGAHANQTLSAASWSQQHTGGGIVTGMVMLVAWGLGGYTAGRMAGRDGLRHGIWVFVVGVVLMTVVGAAITWLPDTETILRNLRLLGLPVRRVEWRDFGSVGGIATIVGMAAGSILGGRQVDRRPAVARPRVPREARPTVADEVEPLFAADTEPAADEAATPAFAGASRERVDVVYEPEPESDPAPAWWSPDEPPAPIPAEPAAVEPEVPAAQSSAESWWPGAGDTEPARAADDAWALPDDEPAQVADSTALAFPPARPAPVGEIEEPAEVEALYAEAQVVPDVEVVPERAPLAEHANWPHDRGSFQAPPEPGDDDFLQHEPETLFDLAPEDDETRRRKREDAASAYEQAREDQ